MFERRGLLWGEMREGRGVRTENLSRQNDEQKETTRFHLQSFIDIYAKGNKRNNTTPLLLPLLGVSLLKSGAPQFHSRLLLSASFDSPSRSIFFLGLVAGFSRPALCEKGDDEKARMCAAIGKGLRPAILRLDGSHPGVPPAGHSAPVALARHG